MVVTDLGDHEAIGAVTPHRVPSDLDLRAQSLSLR
jgi:hypothetical protein